MLNSFKRWVSGGPRAPDLQHITDWAKRTDLDFRRTKNDDGFVIDGKFNSRPWRMEWGPPQRSYIEGRELRIRMEAGLPRDLQMLLLSAPLMETLEPETFEQYTASTQTQIDVSTPEETRWVAMYQKVPLAAAKDLKRRFVAVAWSPQAGAAWIDGPVTQRLVEAGRKTLADDPPLALMTLRGRIYLRLQLPEPEVIALVAMLALFETAATQAARVAETVNDNDSAWPSTGSTAWQTLLPPDKAKGGADQG